LTRRTKKGATLKRKEKTKQRGIFRVCLDMAPTSQ